jgi:hypothetical protein
MNPNTNLSARAFALASGTILAVALGACGQQPRPGVRPALVQQVGNEQQVEDVVAALKLGDVKRARKLLKSMAKRNPADRRVATLREGLDGDPAKLLGMMFFSYRVESGERLTTLSQRFLGDRLKFYLLARYNRLTVDALQPGQLVRIPGYAPAPKPRFEPRPDPKPDTRSDPRPTSSSTARPTPATPASPAVDPPAAGILRGQALAALNRGAVANGVLMLRRARALDPANAAIKNDLARAERLLAAVRARR